MFQQEFYSFKLRDAYDVPYASKRSQADDGDTPLSKDIIAVKAKKVTCRGSLIRIRICVLSNFSTLFLKIFIPIFRLIFG